MHLAFVTLQGSIVDMPVLPVDYNVSFFMVILESSCKHLLVLSSA